VAYRTHLSDGAGDANDGDEKRGVAVRHAVRDGARRAVDVRHVVADIQQHRVQTEVVEDDAAKNWQIHHVAAATTSTVWRWTACPLHTGPRHLKQFDNDNSDN